MLTYWTVWKFSRNCWHHARQESQIQYSLIYDESYGRGLNAIEVAAGQNSHVLLPFNEFQQFQALYVFKMLF